MLLRMLMAAGLADGSYDQRKHVPSNLASIEGLTMGSNPHFCAIPGTGVPVG
jgi:hypothetical protein